MSPKNKKIEDKIASIGDYVSPKESKEISPKKPEKEIPKEEKPPEEEIPTEEIKEKLEELTPEQLKEKIIKLVSEVTSRGLTEEERQKFIDDFKFWNGTLFELLDIGNHLKTIAGRTSLTLTPGQALLIYLGLTGGLVVLLRSDLQQKIFKTKPKERPPKEKPPEEKPGEAPLETIEGGIPKEAPKPKF